MGDKMDDGSSEEVQEKEEDVCALFATSMPRDIWANPSLAALAGLIDEDEDQKDNSNSQAEEGTLIMPLMLCTWQTHGLLLPKHLCWMTIKATRECTLQVLRQHISSR